MHWVCDLSCKHKSTSNLVTLPSKTTEVSDKIILFHISMNKHRLLLIFIQTPRPTATQCQIKKKKDTFVFPLYQGMSFLTRYFMKFTSNFRDSLIISDYYLSGRLPGSISSSPEELLPGFFPAGFRAGARTRSNHSRLVRLSKAWQLDVASFLTVQI